MSRSGAKMLAVDIEDHAADIAAAMRADGVADAVWSFRRMAIAELATIDIEPRPVVGQRTTHYLRHPDVLDALRTLRAICAAGAMLYLSASGLASELGDGDPGANVDVSDRFAPLCRDRPAAHNTRPPVCLYRECELASLVREAGWQVQQTFRSDFGNVKLVASREPSRAVRTPFMHRRSNRVAPDRFPCRVQALNFAQLAEPGAELPVNTNAPHSAGFGCLAKI